MGRMRAIIPIGIALAVAIGTTAFTYRWVKQERTVVSTEVVEKVESVPVVVAVTDLNWGTQLERKMIKVAPFFRESLPIGYATDPDTLVGRVMIMPVRENEPILESKLAPASVASGGVSAVVKPGRRALAVKGDKVIGLAGLIRPGNRVDVLVTLDDPHGNPDKTKTKLVLENILVLATGSEMDRRGEGEKGEDTAPFDVYTLEVTPEEGEKLALAAAEGKLQFALRNATDADSVRTVGATIPKTLASLRPPAAEKQQVPGRRAKRRHRVRPPVITVEIIKGDKVEKLKF
jgi:pilus assembly protein CpaB